MFEENNNKIDTCAIDSALVLIASNNTKYSVAIENFSKQGIKSLTKHQCFF